MTHSRDNWIRDTLEKTASDWTAAYDRLRAERYRRFQLTTEQEAIKRAFEEFKRNLPPKVNKIKRQNLKCSLQPRSILILK